MSAYRQRLQLERLESRQLLSTCNVTRLGDLGIGKGYRGDLRYCLTKTNAEPGEDLIVFQPSAFGLIQLKSPLPVIADDLIIAGPGPELVQIRRTTGDPFPIFTVYQGVTAQIYSLAAINGNSGIVNRGELTLGAVHLVDSFNDSGLGGGVANFGGTLTMFQSVISGNTTFSPCEGGGGGVYNSATGVAHIVDSTITGNRLVGGCYTDTKSFGGAVFNEGTMSIEFSTISDNENSCGSEQSVCDAFGGGLSNAGVLTVVESKVTGNKNQTGHPALDETFGGGFYNKGVLFIDRSQVTGNSSGSLGSKTGNGGGIYSDTGSQLTIENSTIAFNQTPAFFSSQGGGIVLNGATASIDHSTIAGNLASGKSSAVGGGLAILGSATLTLRNSILAGNAATSSPDISGVLTSSGYNLVGNTNGGFGFSGTDLLNVDPKLGPLANNGGPTQTMALLPGSPAIDAGDNTDAPQWDQRGPGFPRIVNGTIDIGAFEVQASDTVTTSIVWLDPLAVEALLLRLRGKS
jgi:hypothetical protein